jgi:2-hydroxychromene-2-carboxylate isomerase
LKTIEYFVTPVSPWCYLGHTRLLQLAKTHQTTIELLPFELGAKIFPQSGGLPLLQRPVQRQAYRLAELKRWHQHLNLPMNIQPQYFPVSDALGLQAIAAAQSFAPTEAILAFTEALMRAVWVDQMNLADPAVIKQIAKSHSIDPNELDQHAAQGRARLDANNQRAVEAQVFGAPWYRFKQENYWGQDRLEFLDRALA